MTAHVATKAGWETTNMNAKQRVLRQRLAAVHEAACSPLVEASAGFNVIGDPDVPEATRMRRVNKFLYDIGGSYHVGVPIREIIDNLKRNGFLAVQEDGSEWEGLVLGRDATWHIDLVDMQTGKPSKRRLNISHHKMDVSGKYEVTAYIS
jgi:hypothetical protein